MAWGFHSILNVAKACPRAIRCPSTITSFSNILVKRIDMKPYGLPMVFKFGEGERMGYTLIQPIETSCITAHFSEEHNDFYLDVFSCKPYNQKTVEETVSEFFKPMSFTHTFLIRQAPQELR